MAYKDSLLEKAREAIIKGVSMEAQLKYYQLDSRNNPIRCPFHMESTASFFWDDSKGVFHCFGCHAKGSVVEFTRRMETEQGNPLNQVQTLEMLSKQYNIPIPNLNKRGIQKGKGIKVDSVRIDEDIKVDKAIKRYVKSIPQLDIDKQVLGWYIYDYYLWGVSDSQETLALLEQLIT